MSGIKRKLGIIAGCLKGVDEPDALEMIREAGFECYFTMWKGEAELAALVGKGKTLGLTCEAIHALFFDVNTIWEAGDAYLPLDASLRETIDAAGRHGVPIVIVHLTSGWTPPTVCDLGLARIDSLLDYAEERGVSLAFENMRVLSHLAVLADRNRSNPRKNLGFCFDFGHENCFTKTIEWMHVFEDRVIATHIHDNFGRGERNADKVDLHLLPFDGTCDYGRMMRQMNAYGCEAPLMLEVFSSKHPSYAALSHEEFLATAYERLKRISEMGE